MSEKLQLILVISSILGMMITINLIKKDVLDLKYSLIWMFLACTALIVSIFPDILNAISIGMGIQVPVNALFLFGFYLTLSVVFSLTIIVSKNSQRIKILNQEISIIKEKIREIENKY